MLTKRGQVTLFIILGIVLLFVVGLAFWVAQVENEVLSVEAQQALDNSIELYPPQKFVDYCVRYHVPLLAQKIALGGGTQFPRDQEYITYKGSDILVWYSQQRGNGFLTPQEVADEMKDSLPFVMQNCLDTRVYEQQGYEVDVGLVEVTNVSISLRFVIVQMNMPLSLRKGDDFFEAESYSVEYPFAIGEVLELGRDLTNSFVQDQYVDTAQLIESSGVQVLRDRPYPYTVYQLNASLDEYPVILQFALEEEDPFGTQYPQQEGCCFVRNSCHAGTSQEVCELKGGFFQSSCSCDTSYDTELSQYFGENDCGVADHGDQWCEYVGGVGGRYVKQFCLDGQVYSDVCKDFKQEVCVSEDQKAKCRDLVYESCWEVQSESVCNDRSLHDCTWVSNKVGCRPAISPGLPFWRGEAQVQCSRASVICKGCSLSSQEIYSSCSQVGDCGQDVNVYGEDGMLPTSNIKFESTQQLVEADELSFQDPLSQQQLLDSSQEQSLSLLLTSAMQTLDELSDVSLADYLNPFKEIPFDSTQVAYCGAWQPPSEGVCSYCMNAQIPCSQYFCRSLGSECVFAQVNGSGFCFERAPLQSGDRKIIDILDAENESLQATQRFGVQGYEYPQEVGVQNPFEVRIQTPLPSRCKLTYLPNKEFDSIGGIELSSAELTNQHDVTLFFVSNFDILDQFLDVFDSGSYIELVDQLVAFKTRLEVLAQQYPLIARFRSGYYPLIAPLVDYYVSADSSAFIEFLLSELERGNYYMFVSCIDETGHQMEDAFISFSFEDVCSDKTPPQAVSTFISTEGELTIELDELSECRFDERNVEFGDMRQRMNCSQSIFDVDVDELVYSCSANTDLDQVYVQCADHPERIPRSPVLLGLIAQSQLDALPIVSVPVLNNRARVNVSSLQPTLVNLELDGEYNCFANQEPLACSSEGCQILLEGSGEYAILCEPVVETSCGPSLVSGFRVTKLPPLIAQSVKVTSDHVLVQIANAAQQGITCEIATQETTFILTQENNQTFKGDITNFPKGVSDNLLTCTSAQGAVLRQEIVVIN